jgi:uncharacterized protein (UPF0548 family)
VVDLSPWMVSISYPSEQKVGETLAERGPYSYEWVGATRSREFPDGFDHDRNAVCLGQGDAAFARAVTALRAWEMFPAPWVKIETGPDRDPFVGQTVAMVARAWGLWWRSGARVVYVTDEPYPWEGDGGEEGVVRRSGFAYGTLESHVEQGEESFMVVQYRDGRVFYRLEAFSRPRLWIVKLAKPLARRLQRRFVRESLARMKAIVEAR